MKKLWIICAIAGLLCLSGCGTTLNQQFATGYGLNTVTRNLTTAAINANKLSYADGKKIYVIQNDTRSALDAAWNIHTVYADSSKEQVSKVNSALTTILLQLEKLGVK